MDDVPMDDDATGHQLEWQYRRLCAMVDGEGAEKPDRTGTGTKSLFGKTIRGPTHPFPLLTSKWVNWKAVKAELDWFLSGSTNVDDLHEYDVGIWDEWSGEDGDVGPVYGAMWRSWPDTKGRCIDQVRGVIEGLRDNPHSRRHLVSAWNVGKLEEMGLPPCHTMYQFYVRPLDRGERLELVADSTLPYIEDYRSSDIETHSNEAIDRRLDEAGVPEVKLDCHLYQRSADLFIGVPYNIASYALLTHLVAGAVSSFDEGPDPAPGELVISYGDAHLYNNHLEQLDEMLDRDPREPPVLDVDFDASEILVPPNAGEGLMGIVEGVSAVGDDPHPYIEAPVAS